MALAAGGLFGVNGIFLYYAITDPGTLLITNHHPMAAAFILEAFALLGILAFFFRHLELQNYHWLRFVILSILGSLLFSIPYTILMHDRGLKQA